MVLKSKKTKPSTALVKYLEPVSEDELIPKKITPPKEATKEQVKKLKSEADALVKSLLKDPQSRANLRKATSVGDKVQTKANKQFTLLRTSLGKVMKRLEKTGDTTTIPADLNKLREIMEEINPYPAIKQLKRHQTAGFFSRLVRKVPGIGKILANIAKKYESVQTQINIIIQSLEAGSDKLLENTLEIEERYKNLKALQKELKINSYKLQLVLKEIEKAIPKAKDPTMKTALEKARVRIMRRLQNLVITQNAFAQFFITMNTTIDNHDNLRDSIRSMVGLVRPVLENGLALKIAQQDEKQIAEALATTQDYLGNLMVAIAEDSMDNAAEIAKVTNKPLANFQDLVKAYKILINRMDEASQIEKQMIEAAQQNMKDLEHMTTELEKRAEAMEESREVSKKAI